MAEIYLQKGLLSMQVIIRSRHSLLVYTESQLFIAPFGGRGPTLFGGRNGYPVNASIAVKMYLLFFILGFRGPKISM